jgi:hypothetical protein
MKINQIQLTIIAALLAGGVYYLYRRKAAFEASTGKINAPGIVDYNKLGEISAAQP